MILGLEIGMIVAGLIALVTGKFALSSKHVATGTPARIAGVVCLLPVPLTLAAALIIGFILGLTRNRALIQTPEYHAIGVGIEVGAVLLCAGVATLISRIYAPSTDGERPPALPQSQRAVEFQPRPPRKLHVPTQANDNWQPPPPIDRGDDEVVDRSHFPVARWLVLGLSGAGIGLLAIVIIFAVQVVIPWANTPDPNSPEAKASLEKSVRAASVRASQERQEEYERQQKNLPETADRARIAQEEANRERLALFRQEQRLSQERQAEEQHQRRLASLAKPLEMVTIPEPTTETEPLAATRTPADGLTWTPVQTASRASPRDRAVGTCWAREGRSLVTLSESGVLRRIGYPELAVQQTLNLGQSCSGLEVSRLGLLITLPKLQELWLFDPETFAIVRRIGMAQLVSVASGPALEVGYAVCRNPPGLAYAHETPIRGDLRDGTFQLLKADTTKLPSPRQSLHNMQPTFVSPDGQWWFASHDQLLVARLDGSTLPIQARNLSNRNCRSNLAVSPDSRRLAVVSPVNQLTKPNSTPKKTPTGKRPTTGSQLLTRFEIYDAADVALTDVGPFKAQSTVDVEGTATTVAFDPASSRLATLTNDHQLVVFGTDGQPPVRYGFGDAKRRANGLQLLFHPTDRRGLLVRTTQELLLVQFTTSE